MRPLQTPTETVDERPSAPPAKFSDLDKNWMVGFCQDDKSGECWNAPHMPKRSDDYMAERRRQILNAAIACLNSQGWNRTTVDDVARQAKQNKGAVYIHFANKRALLNGQL